MPLSPEDKIAIVRVLDYITIRFGMEEKERKDASIYNFSRVERGKFNLEALIEMSVGLLTTATGLDKARLVKVFEYLHDQGIISTMDIGSLKEVRKNWVEELSLIRKGRQPGQNISIETDESRIAAYADQLRQEGIPEGTKTNRLLDHGFKFIKSEIKESNLGFDKELGIIIYGDKKCELPFKSVEYYVAQALFEKSFGTKFTEDDLMTYFDQLSAKADSSDRVYDATRRINKKAKSELHIHKLIKYKASNYWIENP